MSGYVRFRMLNSSPTFADVPQSVLSLGTSLNGSNIKEGDDVYFECNVRANPRPYKITWRFNVSDILAQVFVTFDLGRWAA